jgi:hypothetical protein
MSALTQKRLRELLHYDPESGIFSNRVQRIGSPIGKVVGTPNSNGHLQIMISRRLYMAHRLAWLYVYGVWPTSRLDHKNRQKTDNRIANLREVSPSENCQNVDLYTNNTSGLKGVCWRKNEQRWSATICHQHKQIHLGYFDTKESAHLAYRVAATVLHKCNPSALS